ncbi:30S ribosomal protein S14 [Rubinisphaera sp. JC750]|uniref:30S ribosomal protein S14 n=1 Tax=Rubinisphaera sp. JC750 TaxID=2898658 RepID=UPI001F01BBBB|nr:30S ribosomal protein S14 [Rubinisphaera sp. JC750]
MASRSKIEKQKRNRKLVEKFAEKREALKAAGDYEGLAKLPRSSSRTRLRRLCQLTGRARGNYRKFQISRIMLRDMALDGLIPGMKKASW